MSTTKTKKKAAVSVNPTEIVTTTEDGKVEVLKMKPSVDVLDMKLTRSELIELITDEVEVDLKNQFNAVNKEIENLDKTVNEYFSNMPQEDLINNFFLPEIKKTLEMKGHAQARFADINGYYRENVMCFGSIYLSAKIPQEFADKHKQLLKEHKELKQKMVKLSSKAGKLEIMRQMLSSSEEGQKLLAQIQGFKKSASTKLLGA